MPFNSNDPKWTAYVLGELDVAERVTVEHELADSPEAQKLVTEIRETAKLLESELHAEPTANLLPIQRAKIEHVTKPGEAEIGKPRRGVKNWVVFAIAASMLIAVSGLFLPAVQRARQSGIRTSAMNNMREFEAARLEYHGISDERPDSLASDHYYSELSADTAIATDGASREVAGHEIHGLPSDGDESPLITESFSWHDRRVNDPRASGLKNDDKLSGANDTEAWETVEKSSIPFDDRAPVTYPNGREWNELTARRQKYGYINPDGKQFPGDRDVELGYHFTPDESRDRGWYATHERLENAEAYDSVTDNPFLPAKQNPLSTFSIDVDTASYSNVRRFLTQNRTLPPKGAVRIEELVNYFRYDYPQPAGDVPFSVTTEVAGCPWNAEHRLLRVGLKGREVARDKRPPSNLVFLLDVSGSMSDANKLPLVREAMKLLVEQLTENDRVAIVVYAGNSGLVLPSTTGDKQQMIRAAIDQLGAGGSTNGAGGIQQAYEVASANFIKGGTNRVILATDGDFNVGITNRDDLIKLITEQAKSGVFLTTLGFGMGNLKDGTLEQLADKGNGNYAYIDDLREAKKVFVEQMAGTLITIAKDVKIQIEFNPAQVASYRLIGYENRILAKEDFNDDKKDAGEIGAGHTVTALYELVPVTGKNAEGERPAVDELKYQKPAADVAAPAAVQNELLTLKLRYKQPDGETSKLIETPVVDSGLPYGKATADFKFAASVGLFGMILRDSPYKGTATLDAAAELASEGLVNDASGYRAEFVELIKTAKGLKSR